MLNSTGLLRYGDRAAREVSQRAGGTVADRTALAGLNKAARADGMLCIVASDRSEWVFTQASSAVDTTQNLVVTPTDAAGGAWLRVDSYIDLKLAIAFGTADAAALFTVPTGFIVRFGRLFWEVTTSFTGGASSAIGVSSTNANFNTKGDLLGAAGGDVAATLVSTGSPYKGGTLGAKYGSNGIVVLVAGDVLRYDRITSAFTAGVGFVHAEAQIIN
jgi:hypothetical protein